MSVLLLKQAVPPSEGGKTWNNEYAFADQAAVCSRGCAKPRARFDLPSFFSPPLRSAVNHAKLGESIAQRCWTLTQSATEHCEDCALCFLPSRSREEKGITAQQSQSQLHWAATTWKIICFFSVKVPRPQDGSVGWGFGRFGNSGLSYLAVLLISADLNWRGLCPNAWYHDECVRM